MALHSDSVQTSNIELGQCYSQMHLHYEVLVVHTVYFFVCNTALYYLVLSWPFLF